MIKEEQEDGLVNFAGLVPIICYFIPTKKKGGATKIVIIMVMANTFLPDIEKSMK